MSWRVHAALDCFPHPHKLCCSHVAPSISPPAVLRTVGGEIGNPVLALRFFRAPRFAAHDPEKWWPVFGSDHAQKSHFHELPPQKGREAERRKARRQEPRHISGRYRLPTLRARRAPRFQMSPPESASGALLRRGSCRSANAFDSAQAALHAMQNRRRYLRHAARLSQAPGSPVVMPAGTMPGPPGNGLRDRPREPHSLRSSDRIRTAPFGERAFDFIRTSRRKSILLSHYEI